MTYDKLTRQQVLKLLAFAKVPHDALICHRDGTFTVRYGYAGDAADGQDLMLDLAHKLNKTTRGVITRMRHDPDAMYPYVEMRFGFPALPASRLNDQ